MSIYRGPGGSGDAVNDAASEATLVSQLVTQAQESEANAATSATNAGTSATNAANSATAAATSATNAASSAASALSSKNAAATSEANALTSKNAAATSATNAATSATAAATSASSASTSASTATTQATNASNSASAAATSATNASNSASAAATSATNAASSATSAAGSATTATTQASNASTSATNAASSATSAAGSATTATTQAGIATTKAGEAATSATNAANSASAASTSATNAANSASTASTQATNASNSATSAASSATAAAASYDSFDDRYLGAKATAPTVDNDGNTLLVGALYFNTSSNFMKVWDGSNWLDAYASLSGALLAANNLSDLTNASTARTNLGLAIGTNVQAYDADLAAIAALSPTADNFIVGNGTAWTLETPAQARTSLGVTATGSDTTYAYRANNLSDLASASTARTNLGLGSIATQAANSVAITGGAIDGTTVGATTASSGKFTSLSDSGNLTFTGTGNRITGDFSNATVASRVMFQTSTTNGITRVSAIPNGTGAGSIFTAYADADPTNSETLSIYQNSSASAITSSITGTGTYTPLTISTGGSERLRIDTSGNVGIGTSSPSQKLDVNGLTRFRFVSGTGAGTWLDTTGNASRFFVGTDAVTESWRIYDSVGGAQRIILDSAGNVGIGLSAPAQRLHVLSAGTSAGVIQLGGSGTTGYYSQVNQSGNNLQLIANGDQEYRVSLGTNNGQGFITFLTATGTTGNTERMRIDSSGNVGISVTPSAWSTANSVKALQTPSGALWNFSNNFLYLGQNYYWNGTNRIYINTDGASEYQQNAGTHIWSTAPSGTAGTTATFTERMRIDASGNVSVATTTTTYKFAVGNGTADTRSVFNPNSAYAIGVSNGSGFAGWIGGSGAADTMVFSSSGGTERMRIDSSGNLLVGTTSTIAANARTQIAAGSGGEALAIKLGSNGYFQGFYNTSGTLIGSISGLSGTSTSYNTSSDYRLKENIAPMTGALNVVQQLKPVTYNWKADGSSGQGFIAHELQEIVSDCVTGEKDAVDVEGNPKYQGIDTSFLVATLTKAIQEQQTLIEQLTTRLNALEGK